MKIVVNKCYGGFSLSPKAVKRLAELQGKPCYFFFYDYKTKKYKPTTIKKLSEPHSVSFLWSAYTVPNPDEIINSQKNWHKMSLKERQKNNNNLEKISLDNRPLNRTNPLLIQVIEELGDEANGDFAELRIIEIPDNIEWEIDEYDGIEHVNEKHRSWH